ncbi:hypothetical protein [Caballeronia novacaledonica]|uniref:Gluconolactonase n=1 Tax=Caballeronia novacaledonica TaxID=1544861 RepID=A0AA37IPX3_9BURK|nr:hypothetical protein [Caballeronia novacaledonica]GJH30395.1 hypothetical protein CBA19CS42_37785 [Caballeronia novacaledonica]
MNNRHRLAWIFSPFIWIVATALMLGNPVAAQADDDLLAIGDWADLSPDNPTSTSSTVRFLNVRSGKLVGSLPPGIGGLHGPNGILFDNNRLIVANQNGFLDSNGQIIEFGADVRPGTPLTPLHGDNSPLAPRGIILVPQSDGSRILYVADMGDVDIPGQLLAFRLDGRHTVSATRLKPDLSAIGITEKQFHPRGIVLGPDGYLYVSLRYLPEACGGSVIRFDLARRAFKDVLLSNPKDCSRNVNNLHRPEGLAFGPDGKLYVTSFQQSADDVDRILIIPVDERMSGHAGRSIDAIELDRNQPRASAQALIFGPRGYLYVAILQTGEVRKYDVVTKGYWLFAQPGTLKQPFYLSFTKSNPATLAYKER